MSLRDHINEGWLASTDPDGNQMPYDAFVKDYLWANGLPADINIDSYDTQYNAGDVNRSFSVSQAGQDPIKTTTWEDDKSLLAPYLALAMFTAGALAPAAGGAAGVGGAGGAGAAGAGGGAAAGGGLAAAEGVTALGSAWSPSALGLTGGIAPGVTAAEIAALGTGIPGAVGVGAGAGAAAGGGLLSGGSSGVTSLGSAWSPSALGITPVAPAAGAGELAALGAGIPGAVAAPGASIGASGGLSSADKAALYGDAGYGQGMSGAQTSAYDGILSATGSKGLADVAVNSGIGSGIVDGIKGAADLVGGGSNLAGLIGAGLGAASGGGTETSSRDPWAAAQPFLKNLLGDADAMRANLAQNPFTPQHAGLQQCLRRP